MNKKEFGGVRCEGTRSFGYVRGGKGAKRWFRCVAQIKDISELCEIPDEDFSSIMPMRKGPDGSSGASKVDLAASQSQPDGGSSAQDGGAENKAYTENPTPEDPVITRNNPVNHACEDTHGEWIIVNKSRRSNQVKKGKQSNPGGSGMGGRSDVVKNKFESSKALKVPSSDKEACVAVPSSGAQGNMKPHGIQTTMDVEVLAPNHLRFIDKPPDSAILAKEADALAANLKGDMLVDDPPASNPG
ncbi:hypothetical protein SESBI_31567 [Sesbania bispinosa]|nr:hypothetical protein SESBI_31567 [Sesbania bispinosa]